MTLIVMSLLTILGCKKNDISSSSSNGGSTNSLVPQNVSAYVNGTSVIVTWNPVTDADHYLIYRSSTSNGTYSWIGSSYNTSYSDNNPFKYNYYKVSAVDNNGIVKDQSSYAYCYYPNGGGGSSTVPNTPTNVSSSVSGSSIQITWSSVSNASYYKIYRSSSSSGTYSSLGTSYSTSYNDDNPLTNNYYKITAVNDYGESEKSSYTYCHYTGGGGTAAPSAPTGVSAYFSGSTAIPEITISWNSVSNATSYKIYRSSSAYGSYTYLLSTSITYTYDFNPINGTNYYKVKAVNNNGESSFSDYVSCDYNANAYPPCPPHYTSHTVSGNTITLRWTNPTSSGCGTPTTAKLRVKNPDSNDYITLDTFSGSTTVASFGYIMWANSEGYVYMGIVTENSYGNSGGLPLIYNYKTNTWYGGNGLDGIVDEIE